MLYHLYIFKNKIGRQAYEAIRTFFALKCLRFFKLVQHDTSYLCIAIHLCSSYRRRSRRLNMQTHIFLNNEFNVSFNICLKLCIKFTSNWSQDNYYFKYHLNQVPAHTHTKVRKCRKIYKLNFLFILLQKFPTFLLTILL